MQSFSFIPLEYFFENLPFMLPWQPIKFSDLDKIHMNRRGLLKKHFCKKKSKYLQWDSDFHFCHYKPMETISFHSNQSSYPIGTKNTSYSFPRPIVLYVKFGKNRLHGFREDVVWKCWRTTDGRWMPAYTISSPMALRLRWAKKRRKRGNEKSNRKEKKIQVLLFFIQIIKLQDPISNCSWLYAKCDPQTDGWMHAWTG